MATRFRARKPGDSARRRSKRKHRRASGLYRTFETITAMIPAVVVLIHLTLRSAVAQPQAEPATVVVVPVEAQLAKAPVTIAVVPEPSSLALVGLGTAVLCYRRRNFFPRPAGEMRGALPQSAKIATAVA